MRNKQTGVDYLIEQLDADVHLDCEQEDIAKLIDLAREREKYLLLEFYRWMKERDTAEYAEQYFHYRDEDMLEEFLNDVPETKTYPCEFDHNGECLICDCWIQDCAYDRYLNKDYKWETAKELEAMFKDFIPK